MKRESRLLFAKAVDFPGFDSLDRQQLTQHLVLSGAKCAAVARHPKVKEDPGSRRVTIGKTSFDWHSRKAFNQLHEALEMADLDRVWGGYQTTVYQRNRL